MADYYSEASFDFNLTDEQAKFAITVLEAVSEEEFNLVDPDFTQDKGYSDEVIKVAKEFADNMDWYEPDGFTSIPFSYEIQKGGLWIRSSDDDTINGFEAALFVHLILKHFDIDDYVSFEMSYSCSKPRLNSNGGEAYFITKDEIDSTSTYAWTCDKLKEYKEARGETAAE